MEDEVLDTPNPAPEQPQEPADPGAQSLLDMLKQVEKAEAPDRPEPESITPEPEAEPEYEVTLDGQKSKVKVAELVKGYQRQADYTKKTMETAEQRKQFEQLQTQAQAERQAYAQHIQGSQQALKNLVESGGIRPPDNTLIESDPQEFLRQKARWDQANQVWSDNQQKLQQIQQQEQQTSRQRYDDYLKTQNEQLIAKLPHWTDEAKRTAEVSEIKQFLQDRGVSPQAFNAGDHAVILMARDAMLYAKEKATAEKAKAKLEKAPMAPAVKPGTARESSGPQVNKAALGRLKSSGKVDDFAAFYKSLM